MATNPADKYRHNAILEGGGSGSGGGGEALRETAKTIGVHLAGLGALGALGKLDRDMTKKGDEIRYKERREAADEIKRETRGVEKTPTDRARDDAREMRMQEQNEKASREASRDMGFSKGGTASSRADGIAQRGKTRGTIVMCGGGYMKKAKK